MNDIVEDTVFISDQDLEKTTSGSLDVPLLGNFAFHKLRKGLSNFRTDAIWFQSEIEVAPIDVVPPEVKKSSYAISIAKRIQELPLVECDDLAEAGISPPNQTALNTASIILDELIGLGLTPDHVTSSAQGGVSFMFNNKRDEKLYLETYNSGETGFIVENYKEKKIIENKDLTSLESLVELKDYFSYELPRVSKNW